jgi:hypothetical protein
METINNINYIRATEINIYIECPAKMFFQSIEKVEVPNKIALAGGTAVHNALQINYSQKIETREDLPTENIIDAFSDSFDEEAANVDEADFEYEKPGTVKDSWIDLLKIYTKEVAPRIQPVKVEQRIKVKLKGYEFGLTGRLDIFDEYDVITDHKTTSKPYKETPENYKLQVGGAYPLLKKAISQTDKTEKPPQKARIDYLIRKSPKNNSPHIRHIAVDIDTNYFLNVFSHVSKGIKSEVFPPNRSHIYCTKRFCKFWNECEKKFGGKVRE